MHWYDFLERAEMCSFKAKKEVWKRYKTHSWKESIFGDNKASYDMSVLKAEKPNSKKQRHHKFATMHMQLKFVKYWVKYYIYIYILS